MPPTHRSSAAVASMAPFIMQPAPLSLQNVDSLVAARPERRALPRVIIYQRPVWKGGHRGEAALLASCYASSLRLALEHGLRSVAFPAISTGAYAYPLKAAAVIAIDSVRKITQNETTLEEIIFCCYSGEDLAVYKKLLSMSPDHRST